ncbi:hypothetical protein [Erythrobacter aureus]|uniref:Uncharacterized protein n=1 Tax=Erythrobacter aureus TaxID=2182384 RepID=A0A345YIS7_9SPHN|nr:hypothetical protein [Erythrobacter aureus]AXK43829.1 hypothetical protein DVR09_15345 [Erythrobacter aureus]
MTVIPRLVAAKNIREGDVLDLEGDEFADRPTDDHANNFEYEYQPVHEVERETADCIRIGGDGWLVGFPEDHLLKVIPKED